MATQAGLCLAWSETPEDTFSHGVAHMAWLTCVSNETPTLSREILSDVIHFSVALASFCSSFEYCILFVNMLTFWSIFHMFVLPEIPLVWFSINVYNYVYFISINLKYFNQFIDLYQNLMQSPQCFSVKTKCARIHERDHNKYEPRHKKTCLWGFWPR